jgi:hypothetical protein
MKICLRKKCPLIQLEVDSPDGNGGHFSSCWLNIKDYKGGAVNG